MADVQARMVARGRVQGVYYRASLQREALQRSVRGWVRNCPDGSVEAVLQGPDDAVKAVLAWARTGPRGAIVEALDVDWTQPQARFPTFEVKP